VAGAGFELGTPLGYSFIGDSCAKRLSENNMAAAKGKYKLLILDIF